MELVIAILGLVIAWFTYRKTFHSKPKEELEAFVLHFRATQEMSKSLRVKLSDYAERNRAWDKPMFTGISFRQYILMMEQGYAANLSDELFDKVLKSDPSKSLLLSMTASLQTQLADLTKLDTELNMLNLKGS